MSVRLFGSSILFGCVLACAAGLELRGKIEPAAAGEVILHSVATPFSTATRIGLNGEFRFKNLEAGAYTLAIVVPGSNQTRQTVEVVPAAADKHGRVYVKIAVEPGATEGHHKVHVKQLAVPDTAARLYLEAQRSLSKNDTATAIEQLERAVRLAPQFVAAWNHLGTIAYQTKRYESAEKCFRAALEGDSTAFEPMVNLGGVLLTLERFEEALQYNRFAVSLRDRDALANSQLGMNYFFLRDFEQAEPYLKTAKKIDPAHFSYPQIVLAEIYLARKQTELARAEIEDFLVRHPEEAPRAKAVLARMPR